jgi:hypothetical protein
MNDNMLNPNPLENGQGHIDTGATQGPDFTIKIRHPVYSLFVNGKYDITCLDSGLFKGPPGCNPLYE